MRSLWFLLLTPYAVLSAVPFYNRSAPEFLGFPFFYWLQLLLVPIGSLAIYLAHRRMGHDR